MKTKQLEKPAHYYDNIWKALYMRDTYKIKLLVELEDIDKYPDCGCVIDANYMDIKLADIEVFEPDFYDVIEELKTFKKVWVHPEGMSFFDEYVKNSLDIRHRPFLETVFLPIEEKE